jgi:hypothetical protein
MTRDGDDERGWCVSVVGVVRAVCHVCVYVAMDRV